MAVILSSSPAIRLPMSTPRIPCTVTVEGLLIDPIRTRTVNRNFVSNLISTNIRPITQKIVGDIGKDDTCIHDTRVGKGPEVLRIEFGYRPFREWYVLEDAHLHAHAVFLVHALMHFLAARKLLIANEASERHVMCPNGVIINGAVRTGSSQIDGQTCPRFITMKDP